MNSVASGGQAHDRAVLPTNYLPMRFLNRNTSITTILPTSRCGQHTVGHECFVELDTKGWSVVVKLGRRDGVELTCPECGQTGPGYDTQTRRWRHLDTCQFQTILEADVPRMFFSEHGVRQVRVPWAEAKSHFTALFERLAIDWMTGSSDRPTVTSSRLANLADAITNYWSDQPARPESHWPGVRPT